jgi:hypothetical protein
MISAYHQTWNCQKKKGFQEVSSHFKGPITFLIHTNTISSKHHCSYQCKIQQPMETCEIVGA